jgi:hypothetical protein
MVSPLGKSFLAHLAIFGSTIPEKDLDLFLFTAFQRQDYLASG